MDVIFETRNRSSFTMEVGYFDTVLEIKEKIHNYLGIPVSHQILAFGGKLLDNGGDVQSCFICHNSRIQLLIVDPNQGLPDPPKITNLLLKLPKSSSTTSTLCLPINLSDSVLHLKHKLCETQGLPTERLVLYLDGKTQLRDAKCLSECGVSDGSQIEVLVKAPVTPSRSSGSKKLKTPSRSSGSKKPKTRMLPWCKMCLNDQDCYNDSNFLLGSDGERLWECLDDQKLIKFFGEDEQGCGADPPWSNGSSHIIEIPNFDCEDMNYPDPGSPASILAAVKMGFDSINASLRKNIKRNHLIFKWVFVVLNLLIAVCGATLTEINAQGRIKDSSYHKINVATAFICLLMSIAEFTEELRDSNAVWRKRRHCFWFHYPGKEGRFFGRPSLYFGILSSMIQVGLTLTIVLTKKVLVKFDFVPLILATCDVVTLIVDSRPSVESTDEKRKLDVSV